MGQSILSQIIELLVGGISGVATGIGQGLSTLASSIFITETTVEGVTTYGLSTFGTLVIVFAGVSLALGLCRLVMQFITSLGARNR